MNTKFKKFLKITGVIILSPVIILLSPILVPVGIFFLIKRNKEGKEMAEYTRMMENRRSGKTNEAEIGTDEKYISYEKKYGAECGLAGADDDNDASAESVYMDADYKRYIESKLAEETGDPNIKVDYDTYVYYKKEFGLGRFEKEKEEEELDLTSYRQVLCGSSSNTKFNDEGKEPNKTDSTWKKDMGDVIINFQ